MSNSEAVEMLLRMSDSWLEQKAALEAESAALRAQARAMRQQAPASDGQQQAHEEQVRAHGAALEGLASQHEVLRMLAEAFSAANGREQPGKGGADAGSGL